MRRTIASKINYDQWAGSAERPSRWRYFDELDRHLDGCFYEHLSYSFYDEARKAGVGMVPLEDRRPSSRCNWPDMISTWCGRKLWAGRHVPRISHSSDKISELVDQLVQTTKFYSLMEEATVRGSVGSVAITFRVDNETQDEPQVAFRVWKARDCLPQFDDFGNLAQLRVFYSATGRDLLAQGFVADNRGEPLARDYSYWWTRIFATQFEATLVPVRRDDWNPTQGWVADYDDVTWDQPVLHGLGIVPGVWIRNLGPRWGFDGKGTWCKAVDNVVEADYLMSQCSRGTRYNCSPELVIVGTLRNADEFERSPASFLHLDAGYKEPDGQTVGEGSASLLEMSGAGIKAAQEQIDKLRNMTLESVGATRKDPEKLKGVMSGRAMEFLDEDSHDLVMNLRSSYGDGALELFRKVIRAIGSSGDPKGLRLEWPRLYQPTPEDLAHLIPALVLAITPVQEPLEPEEAAKISGGAEGVTAGESTREGGQQVKEEKTVTHKGAGGASHTVKQATTTGPAAQGGRPSVAPTGGKNLGALLEVEEASAYLKNMMDIDLLPNAEKSGVADSDEPVPVLPPPLDDETSEGGGADGERDLLEVPASP